MDTIIGLCHICCLLFCLPAFTTQADVLYPYGALEGDTSLPKEDDGGTLIHIDIDFPFFDQNHRSLFINTNGIISFLENVLEYTPESFPLGDNRRVIAPFWADVDTSVTDGHGDIWYRQVNNKTKLLEITDEVMRVFAVDFAFRPFVAEWALIVTWSEVTFYNKHGQVDDDRPQNTFQAILVTDGVHSFTIFNYGQIEWTTGASSGGDKHTGLGQTDDAIAAQVGFNAGDNKNYYSVPNSRTNAIVNIADTTNVGRVGSEGRWVFRIDNKEIVAAGCEDRVNTILQIYPEQVSMLGGDVLTISGPCFNPDSDVYCIIDGTNVKAMYDFTRDAFSVRCPVPMLMRLGTIGVELSKDGEIAARGFVVSIGLERQTPRVAVSDIASDVLEINLNPNNFPDQTSVPESTRIDVLIYSYKEDKKTAEIIMKPEVAIKRNFRLSQTKFLVNKVPLPDVDVAIYRVVESGMVDVELELEERWRNGVRESRGTDQPIAAMWSLPYNPTSESSSESIEWCEEWAEEESILDVRSDNVPPCPCTLQQAVTDVGQFERHPWCNVESSGEKENCRYRTNGDTPAKHCVRARMPSTDGRGQLCCYGNDNNILILKDVPEGGFVQSNHHSGFNPVIHPGTVPYLSNYHNDRVPWEQCCAKPDDKGSCDLFRERRPSDDCKMYKPPKAGTIFGDPHFVTFDGSDYTFNGNAEFHILKVSNPQIELQGRMAETMKDVRATGIIAMTMQSDTSNLIQVELNERRVMDTWQGVTWNGAKRKRSADRTKRSTVRTWRRLGFFQFSYWDYEGVTVEQLTSGSDADSEITVLVIFDTGVAIRVTVPKNANAMSVIVLVPPDMKHETAGLLGTWNDDKTDDIQTPAREIIDREDPYALHYNYGLSWPVSATESLFRYDIGTNHTVVNNLDYSPTLRLGSTVPEPTLQQVCGESWACRYDFHKTNNETAARSTKDAEDNFDDTDKGTTPVSTCGYLTPPENGNKEGIVYINGSSVTLTCNNGYRLTGNSNRMCVSGAWSGNVTVCEQVEDHNIILIIIIAAVIGGVLVLFLCCFCLLCLCRRKKKKNPKDHEMGSLTHPVHTPNGHIDHAAADQDSEAGSYDRPLPMTPDEEAGMADELYANGRVMEAKMVSNGHAGGHHGNGMPSGPPLRPPSAASTSHHNGYPGHKHVHSHHQRGRHRYQPRMRSDTSHLHSNHHEPHVHQSSQSRRLSEQSTHLHPYHRKPQQSSRLRTQPKHMSHSQRTPYSEQTSTLHANHKELQQTSRSHTQLVWHLSPHHSEPLQSSKSHDTQSERKSQVQSHDKKPQQSSQSNGKQSKHKSGKEPQQSSRSHGINSGQKSRTHHSKPQQSSISHGKQSGHMSHADSHRKEPQQSSISHDMQSKNTSTSNHQKPQRASQSHGKQSEHMSHVYFKKPQHSSQSHDMQSAHMSHVDSHRKDSQQSHDVQSERMSPERHRKPQQASQAHDMQSNHRHMSDLDSHKEPQRASRSHDMQSEQRPMSNVDSHRKEPRRSSRSHDMQSDHTSPERHRKPHQSSHTQLVWHLSPEQSQISPSHDTKSEHTSDLHHREPLTSSQSHDTSEHASHKDPGKSEPHYQPSHHSKHRSHWALHHSEPKHPAHMHYEYILHSPSHENEHHHHQHQSSQSQSEGNSHLHSDHREPQQSSPQSSPSPVHFGRASTSNHDDQPSTSRNSHLPAGAVSMFPAMEGPKDPVKKANLVGPPPKKGPKMKAKENDYDDPLAVRQGKTRMPSDYAGGYARHSENDSESEDEIARIKAQMQQDRNS